MLRISNPWGLAREGSSASEARRVKLSSTFKGPGELAQFWVVFDERTRDPDRFAFQNGNKLESIHRSLAQIVIVRDHIGFLGVFSNLFCSGNPRIQFLRRVKMIISFPNIRPGGKPVAVIAAVKTDVANARGNVR